VLAQLGTATDPQVARSVVLRIFNQNQIFLLVGAAIMTVGLLAAGFALLRRRLDPLLLWFATFAGLYGAFLVFEYQPLWNLGVQAPVLSRMGLAVGLLVPVPAFFFFDGLNLLGKAGRLLRNSIWPIAVTLAILTVALGYNLYIDRVNNVAVLAALLVLAVALLRVKNGDREVSIIRWGVLFFCACALYNNIVRVFPHYFNIEPFAFMVLLACLGTVAGRRALAQELELSNIQSELEIARSIQLSILPSAFPNSASFRVAARYLPMTSVAGDFYDFLLANDKQAGILIADVSGHGVPAALIASMIKLAAAAQIANTTNPAKLLSGINATLMGNTQEQFATAAYVYLDAEKRQLQYAAAAHPAMLLLRNGEVTKVVENGLMLAAFEFAEYTTLSLPLVSGDRLVLYTDGILEAANSREEEFGGERLGALLRATVDLTPAETAGQIAATVQQWAVSQGDDLTVIVCDYIPTRSE
jgi:sigma-B regulation protein RsbU (phosphoserine phosphatase)